LATYVVVNSFWPPFNVKTDNSVPSYSVTTHRCGYGAGIFTTILLTTN